MSSSFTSSLPEFKKTIFQLSGWLRQLRDASETLDLTSTVRSVTEMLDRVETSTFSIAIVGEFKRGKSTLINALLGQEILPADILPTTATLNRITYGIRGQVQIQFKDGQVEDIALDQLTQYVTKLTPEAEQMAALVKEAVVYYPSLYCQNNVDIIDTPGLSDEAAMTDITLDVIFKVDAAIFVIMAQSPFSESERIFLENYLLKADLGRILFVVTGIDRCNRTEDITKVIQSVESRIKTAVLKSAKETFHPESIQYQDYINRMGQLRILGVSAYQALQAKKNGDTELLIKSRFPELEMVLEKLLTEERGIIFLQVPINRILSVSKTVLDKIVIQQAQLQEKQLTLRKQYEQAIARRAAEYQQKEDTLTQHKKTVNTLQQRLSLLLKQLKTDFKKAANQTIDDLALTSDDFKQLVVSERMINFDQKLAGELELYSRRWAGNLQIEFKRGIAEIHESYRPDAEQTNRWLNEVGLYSLTIGAALKKQTLQSRLAWRIASETVGGMTGWLNQNLRNQDIVSTFKNAYKAQISEIIIRHVQTGTQLQKLQNQLPTLLVIPEIRHQTAEKIENKLADHRLELEHQEVKINLSLQNTQIIQKKIRNIQNEAQCLRTKLAEFISKTQ